MRYAILFLLLFVTLSALASGAYGQDGPPPEDGPRDEQAGDRRPNLLAELGLSADQVQQIRRMNRERRPAMMDAQRRMRDANRALDMAIYRDAVRDEEFQARLKDLQSAQAELARLRFESELSVRKILTPDQLVRFRELRRRFAEARQSEIRNRRMRRGGKGLPSGRDVPPQPPPDNY